MHEAFIVLLTLILPFLLLTQIKNLIMYRKIKHNCHKNNLSFPLISILGLIMSDFDCGGCDGGCDGGDCDCGDCSGCNSSNDIGCCDCCILGLFLSDSSCTGVERDNARRERQLRERELERKRYESQQKPKIYEQRQPISQNDQIIRLRNGDTVISSDQEQLVKRIANQDRKISVNWISMVTTIPYERVYEILSTDPNFAIKDGYVTKISTIDTSQVDSQTQKATSIKEQIIAPSKISCPFCQEILESPEIAYCPNCGTKIQD